MPLNTQPLSDKFGVAITGVDLSKEPDEKLFNEIVDIFVKKQVLVFRDQHIEPQHQVAFSRRFGPLEMLYDEDQLVTGFPEIAIRSNENVDGKFIGVVAAGDFWHSDQSYRQKTSLATFLYAHKLPKHGGDTEFADMQGAYESLPDDIKKRIDGRMGIHQRSKLGNPRVAVSREGGEERLEVLEAGLVLVAGVCRVRRRQAEGSLDPQGVVGTEGADLHGWDRVFEVVDRARRAGEVENVVDQVVELDRL